MPVFAFANFLSSRARVNPVSAMTVHTKGSPAVRSSEPEPESSTDLPAYIMAKDVVELHRGNTAHLGSTFPHLPTKPTGGCYLIDMCPDINGSTSRRELHLNGGEGVTWHMLREYESIEWRCFQLIQSWKRLAWGIHRLAFKRRCWGLMGQHLKMIKNRNNPRASPFRVELEMGPTLLPDDGSRERTYPHARQHVDRQGPRAASSGDPQGSIVSRHRILRPL